MATRGARSRATACRHLDCRRSCARRGVGAFARVRVGPAHIPCQTSAGSPPLSAVAQPSGRSGNIRTSLRQRFVAAFRTARIASRRPHRSGFTEPGLTPSVPRAVAPSPVSRSWQPPSAVWLSWCRAASAIRAAERRRACAEHGDGQPPVEVGANQPVAVALFDRWLARVPAGVHRDLVPRRDGRARDAEGPRVVLAGRVRQDGEARPPRRLGGGSVIAGHDATCSAVAEVCSRPCRS